MMKHFSLLTFCCLFVFSLFGNGQAWSDEIDEHMKSLALRKSNAELCIVFKNLKNLHPNDQKPFLSYLEEITKRRLNCEGSIIHEKGALSELNDVKFYLDKQGSILLTGAVDTSERRIRAQRLAWKITGVKEVVNEVQIVGKISQTQISKDLEALEHLQTTLSNDQNISSSNYSINVVNGVVYLAGFASNNTEKERVISYAQELRLAKKVVSYIGTDIGFMPASKGILNGEHVKSAQNASSNSTTAGSNPSANNGSRLSNLNDVEICKKATSRGGDFHHNIEILGPPRWLVASNKFVKEAKARGLSCNVGKSFNHRDVVNWNNDILCEASKLNLGPNGNIFGNSEMDVLLEIRSRSISCGETQSASKIATASSFSSAELTTAQRKAERLVAEMAALEAERADTQSKINSVAGLSDNLLCLKATDSVMALRGVKQWIKVDGFQIYVTEAKRRGLSCGVVEASNTQATSATVSSPTASTSAELTAAQRKAERLEAELAALKAEQQQEQQTISNDTRVPIIDQLVANTRGKQGIVTGQVRDNTGIAEVTVDGEVVEVRSDGRFEHRTFVPSDGKQVLIEVTDLAGLTSQKQISLSRDTAIQSASISFDSLNPIGKRVAKNTDALALIIGVEGYKNTQAQAIYADSDAKMFRDYASEKLGIPESRIETLINDGAELTDMLLSVKNWLARSVKQDKTDVYIFFAGHGLASDDGKKMYLLPFDGSPQLLDRTAILRDELFSDIAAANPRSVTVFLDTCYSGTTRGTDMLIASRPIAIRAKQQSLPDGFTVFTAAGGDQTAKPLEEAKHGMFSYFLMKGMEGDADSNRDNQITAAELHEYVEQNVVQQSGGSQVPELQGDANRILVRFQ